MDESLRARLSLPLTFVTAPMSLSMVETKTFRLSIPPSIIFASRVVRLARAPLAVLLAPPYTTLLEAKAHLMTKYRYELFWMECGPPKQVCKPHHPSYPL